MTTGVRSVDLRSSVTVTNGQTRLIGPYFYKSWSGNDTAVSVRQSGKGSIGPRNRRGLMDPRAPGSQNAYTASITRSYDSVLRFRQINQQGQPISSWSEGTMLGDFGFPAVGGSSWDTNWEIELIGKLREAVTGSDFSLSTFLGESPQTIRMIGDSASRLYSGYRAARRLDGRGVARALGCAPSRRRDPSGHPRVNGQPLHVAAANLWLEYSYGWVPLLHDVEGATKAIANKLHRPVYSLHRVRKRWSFSNQHLAFSGPFHMPSKRVWRGQYLCFQAVTTDAMSFDMTLVSVPNVAWELTPFSFVADWFIPIGDYLSALAFAKGSDSRTFVLTKKHEFEVEGVMSGKAYEIVPGPYHRYYSVDVTRTVSSTLNVPLPCFRGLSDVPTWRKAITSVALLIQGFSSSPQRAPVLPTRR